MPFNMLITLSGPFYDESEHIQLTHVSSAIALFLCLLDYSIGLLDFVLYL